MFEDKLMTNTKSELSTAEEIKKLTFVVFDLETTGGHHQNDKIIEIGLVRISELQQVEEKSFLIDPEIKIPEFIQKLTNIKTKDVKGAAKIEEVVDEILEFMGTDILIAHNTSFDVPFFNSVLRRLGRDELKNPSICTNLMTKYLIPNLLNSNLNYMSKIFNIKHQKAHRALDDAKATAELFVKYLKIFIQKDIQKLNHLYYPRNRYELDSFHYKENNKENIESALKNINELKTPALLTLKGENGIILYCLPCIGHPDELKFITEKLNSSEWMTASIKLFGPFLEALIHFNGLFSKMESSAKTSVIKLLWSIHLPKVKFPSKDQEDISKLNKEAQLLGDFVITQHLVPEQLIILPLESLNSKNQLIFRYPSHRKKLLQYINSKSQRLLNNKLKKTHYSPLVRIFIHNYLLKEQEKNQDLFFFKKKGPIQNPDDFSKSIDEFLLKSPNKLNYPADFI
jgi:DNA polymerase-3 subunit alpha (Gram-positive type)